MLRPPGPAARSSQIARESDASRVLRRGFDRRGRVVRRVLVALAALAVLSGASASSAGAWSFVGTNTVVSKPVSGGGYPVPPGSTLPTPGTCRAGSYNSNHSESWLAVQPGTETIGGEPKVYFAKLSTVSAFHL